MLSKRVQYQGKAGFLIEFSKRCFSKYWQVQTRWVFTQIVTFIMHFNHKHLLFLYCKLTVSQVLKQVWNSVLM